MLSLQYVKAAAVFVSSRHRDFVAEVGNCGSRALDLIFLVPWPSSFLSVPSGVSAEEPGPTARTLQGPVQMSKMFALSTLASVLAFTP